LALDQAAETPAPGRRMHGGVLSERLTDLLQDVLEGRSPNAGRFCGYCYHPIPTVASNGPRWDESGQPCPHCGRLAADWPPVAKVPIEVIAMYKRKLSREGLVVRTFAWVGLTLGVTLGLLPLAFWGVTWWSVVAFFGTMVFFYIGSANLANSVGDALGYRWGQSQLRRRWEAFVRARERG
jgi:hypothetical protein